MARSHIEKVEIEVSVLIRINMKGIANRVEIRRSIQIVIKSSQFPFLTLVEKAGKAKVREW